MLSTSAPTHPATSAWYSSSRIEASTTSGRGELRTTNWSGWKQVRRFASRANVPQSRNRRTISSPSGRLVHRVSLLRMGLEREDLALDPEAADPLPGAELERGPESVGVGQADPAQPRQGLGPRQPGHGRGGRGGELDRLVAEDAAESEPDHGESLSPGRRGSRRHILCTSSQIVRYDHSEGRSPCQTGGRECPGTGARSLPIRPDQTSPTRSGPTPNVREDDPPGGQSPHLPAPSTVLDDDQRLTRATEEHQHEQGLRRAEIGTSLRDEALARNLERLAWLMDRAVGSRDADPLRLDALLGLLPVGGDVLTGVVQAALVLVALHHYRVPKSIALRMMGNVVLDIAVGSIPLLGDLFDVAFKANTRNLRLLEPYRVQGGSDGLPPGFPASLTVDLVRRGTPWRYILPIAAVLITLLALVIIGFITLVRWVFA